MIPAEIPRDDAANLSREDLTSALFANLIMQQTSMALMLLGKVPHPESGETVQDIESAKMLIDQLEMIEVKTKGNLNKNEDRLLKQSLASLHMSFVEAVEKPVPPPGAAQAQAQAPPQAGAQAQSDASSSSAAQSAEEDSRKKFTKRY